MVNKLLICLRRVNVLNLKTMKKEITSPFMIYADFESILVPDDNEKQNSTESYTNKYKKHVTCSYGDKFICADDKFTKPFKSY